MWSCRPQRHHHPLHHLSLVRMTCYSQEKKYNNKRHKDIIKLLRENVLKLFHELRPKKFKT